MFLRALEENSDDRVVHRIKKNKNYWKVFRLTKQIEQSTWFFIYFQEKRTIRTLLEYSTLIIHSVEVRVIN